MDNEKVKNRRVVANGENESASVMTESDSDYSYGILKYTSRRTE